MINILISQSFQYTPERNEVRDFLDTRYIKFLYNCNINAIPVPNNTNSLKKYFIMHDIEGVILSGGNDIFFKPKSKNIRINKKIKSLTFNRNLIEKKLINFASRKKIPIVGICRGFQFLNHYFKGKISPITGHASTNHRINVKKDKISTYEWTKLIDNKVNSYHNFGIKLKDLPKRFVCVASLDNNVEAAFNLNKRHMGIMWHPERKKNFSKKNIKLFKKLFNA
jgi:N5-(cytidine 5'-diphosphoramidyl)-L-glutamine hydrolase